MAKTRAGKGDLDFSTIRDTIKLEEGFYTQHCMIPIGDHGSFSKQSSSVGVLDHTIKFHNLQAGDCVLMRASRPNAPPYVARVENLETDRKGKVRVHVRWYYRPEEASCGRQPFHGAKELLLSDHYDYQSAKTIEGKCIVHPFKEYTKLEDVGAEDYYSRFEYNARTKEITPDRISVYCKCEMPYNPDDLMIQCDSCKDWFHPVCVKMTTAQIKQLSNYRCDQCSS